MIGVEDSGAGASKVVLFGQSLGVTYPLFFDESRQVGRAFAVRASSTTYILSADFVVRDKVERGTSKGYLERAWARYGQGAP